MVDSYGIVLAESDLQVDTIEDRPKLAEAAERCGMPKGKNSLLSRYIGVFIKESESMVVDVRSAIHVKKWRRQLFRYEIRRRLRKS